MTCGGWDKEGVCVSLRVELALGCTCGTCGLCGESRMCRGLYPDAVYMNVAHH